MTRQEVIEHLCKTAALAYHSIADYNEANDCFCMNRSDNYQNSGKIPTYVRDAVKEKLQRDGFKLNQDPDEPI